MQFKKNKNFWTEKKVFLTGFNGFKGSWMTIMLERLGAKVYGYSLNGKKEKINNKCLRLEHLCEEFLYGNILDIKKMRKFYMKIDPDIVIHMASESLVLNSFKVPEKFFRTNILGLSNIAMLTIKKKTPILVLTSDKCYENHEKKRKFVETDSLNGDDPYSASKACQEIVCNSLRKSFNLSIATARAGNVIGGCDFNEFRIIGDIMKAVFKKKKITIRNLNASRPWQHVLEINSNYLKFLRKFYSNKSLSDSWNFGPNKSYKVKHILEYYLRKKNFMFRLKKHRYKEKTNLNLSSKKLALRLNIKNKTTFKKSLDLTYEWYEQFYLNPKNIYNFSVKQVDNAINEYQLYK
jgi:CDP-glucose 4,6-dehydratase